MQLNVRTETFNVGDHRWLGSDHGVSDGDPATLNVASGTPTFVAAHYANGFIPSGTLLGKITASGLYGPYDDGAADGRETCVGHLLTDIITDGTADVSGSLMRHGHVVEAFLPTFTGTTDGEIDAAAKADLPLFVYV
jgi:hypothetical protein